MKFVRLCICLCLCDEINFLPKCVKIISGIKGFVIKIKIEIKVVKCDKFP